MTNVMLKGLAYNSAEALGIRLGVGLGLGLGSSVKFQQFNVLVLAFQSSLRAVTLG